MYEAYKPFRDLSCTVCLKIESTPTTMTPTIEPSQTVTPTSDDGKLNVCILYSLI